MRTHYEVLGVSRAASFLEIKNAWHAKARALHPDRNGGTPEANAAFAEVTQAWAVLSDEKRRRAYDKAAEVLTEPCSACNGDGRIGKQKGFAKRVYVTCKACGGAGRVSR